MSSAHDLKIRDYGLEFIKDLANDRKFAIDTMGVAFTGLKNDLMNRSNIIARKEDRTYVESILKAFDEEVKRTIESQLTRITIKSFNWMKKVMLEDFGVIDQKEIQEYHEKNKAQANNILRLNLDIESLQQQLKEKLKDYSELEENFNKYHAKSSQKLSIERTKYEELSNQNMDLFSQVKNIKNDLNEKNNKLKEIEDRYSSLEMELIDKTAQISRLNNIIDNQAQSTMNEWANAYSEQQGHYQKALQEQKEIYKKAQDQFQVSLTRVKQDYEENINRKLGENTKKYQDEIDSLKEELAEEQKKWIGDLKEYNIQITDLTAEKDLLKEKNRQLNGQLTILLEQNEKIMKEITNYRVSIDELKKELEEEKTKQSLNEMRNVNEYIEQVLSLSNYAPIAILVRMNGEMSLESLAKSVGMDPIVLENQLQPLHKRDLIDIKRDGRIIANIPNGA
ncbi:hypothetical protein [Candidatus Hodarchaeum mangrovi]